MKKDSRFVALLFVFVVTPIIVAIVILISRSHWYPAGDMAQAELHMRGFFRRPPLVGAAGRIVSDSGFQGSHPGPSLWIAMLPVYLIGGRSSGALMAAAASVHIASLAGILLLVRQRFGRSATVTSALVLLAVLRSSGTDFMIEPWNPWLALLPFAVFILLILEMVSPTRGSWAGSGWRQGVLVACTVVVGSHCVQSHAGYVLLVVPPLILGLGCVTLRGLKSMSNSDTGRRWSRILQPALWGAGTAALAWLPPIVDQVRRRPGNLSILFQHFGSPEEPTLGLSKSIDIFVSQMNLLGPWLFGPAAPNVSLLKWLGFIGFVALFGSSMIATRKEPTRVVFVVLSGFMLLGFVSILRIFGPFYEYTVRWFWLLAGLSIAWSSAVLWDRTASRVDTSRRRTGLTSVLVLALSIMTIVQVVDRVKLPGATDSRILAGLIDRTAERLDRNKTYQVRFYDPYTLNATGFGLALELERRGFSVKVDPEFAAAALPHRTAPMQETDQVLWVVVGPALEKAKSDPVLTLLAEFNPRTPQQQERSEQLLIEVEKGLRAAGRADLVSSLETPGASILFTVPPLPDATADLVRELIRMGQPTGIFAMSVSDVAISLG